MTLWNPQTAAALVTALQELKWRNPSTGILEFVRLFLHDPHTSRVFEFLQRDMKSFLVHRISQALVTLWTKRLIPEDMLSTFLPVESSSSILTRARMKALALLPPIGDLAYKMYEASLAGPVDPALVDLLIRCSTIEDSKRLSTAFLCYVHTVRCTSPDDTTITSVMPPCQCPSWPMQSTIVYTARDDLPSAVLSIFGRENVVLHAGRVSVVVDKRIVGPLTALEATLICGLGNNGSFFREARPVHVHSPVSTIWEQEVMSLFLPRWASSTYESETVTSSHVYLHDTPVVDGFECHEYSPRDGTSVFFRFQDRALHLQIDDGEYCWTEHNVTLHLFSLVDVAERLAQWEGAQIWLNLQGVFYRAQLVGVTEMESWIVRDLRIPQQSAPESWFSLGRVFEPCCGTICKIVQTHPVKAHVFQGPMPHGSTRFRIHGRPIQAIWKYESEGSVVLDSASIDSGDVTQVCLDDFIAQLRREDELQTSCFGDAIDVHTISRLLLPHCDDAEWHVSLALKRLSSVHKVITSVASRIRFLPLRVEVLQPSTVLVPLASTRQGVCVICQENAASRWVHDGYILRSDPLCRLQCCGLALHQSCATKTSTCPQCRTWYELTLDQYATQLKSLPAFDMTMLNHVSS